MPPIIYLPLAKGGQGCPCRGFGGVPQFSPHPSICSRRLLKMSLEGKVALVTGAASGIGKAIAIEMARQGASVVVNYHSNKGPGQPVVDEIAAAGGKAIAIQADVSKSDDINRMVQQAVEKFGKIDVLVNNAGIEDRVPFLERTEEEWDLTLAVDLKGPFLCSQAAAR